MKIFKYILFTLVILTASYSSGSNADSRTFMLEDQMIAFCGQANIECTSIVERQLSPEEPPYWVVAFTDYCADAMPDTACGTCPRPGSDC